MLSYFYHWSAHISPPGDEHTCQRSELLGNPFIGKINTAVASNCCDYTSEEKGLIGCCIELFNPTGVSLHQMEVSGSSLLYSTQNTR